MFSQMGCSRFFSLSPSLDNPALPVSLCVHYSVSIEPVNLLAVKQIQYNQERLDLIVILNWLLDKLSKSNSCHLKCMVRYKLKMIKYTGLGW